MIKIKKQIAGKVIEHALNDAPIEACGYLAGRDGIITRQFRLSNADNSADHYSFDPTEQFKVLRKVRNEKLEILANYHSHPLSPAIPSMEDIRLAFDEDILYFIVSLAGNKPVINAYRIKNSVTTQIELVIID